MYYINAVELLNTCIKSGILQGEENDFVFIYHNAGNDVEKFPEGWYKQNVDDTAMCLMNDNEGINILEEALKEKGISVHYTDIDKMYSDCDEIMTFLKTMADTGHAWDSSGKRIALV